jgi:aspartate/tyrosine/aromatic aminotransferase
MFESVETAPADPILGLTEEFVKDPREDKINLSVGVFKDKTGATPVLKCVRDAERLLLERETSKGYKPIAGDPGYGARVRELLFGVESALATGGRAQTAHTPGGTGALRVVGDYLKKLHPNTTLWLSNPTWANHPKIFEAAGLSQAQYAYFDPASNRLELPALLEQLKQMKKGDVVLLHACCHNPTGVDPTVEQWSQIADLLVERGAVPIVDFAYQGFGDGLDEEIRLYALYQQYDHWAVWN